MKITIPMYEKGRSFIMAAGLVKAYEGEKFVYLHLLCQGFENIGKAILLAHDYGKYGPQLCGHFGHHLDIILTEVNSILGIKLLSAGAEKELLKLSEFYKNQQLRYGHKVDFQSFPNLKADQLHHEIVEHLIVLNKKFNRIR